MYLRGLGIPMLVWIDDMCGMTEQQYSQASDEELNLRLELWLSLLLYYSKHDIF